MKSYLWENAHYAAEIFTKAGKTTIVVIIRLRTPVIFQLDCGNYKAENPCNFSIGMEICSAAVTTADVQIILAGKKTKMKKCVSGKTGKEFKAAFYLSGNKVLMQFEDKKK